MKKIPLFLLTLLACVICNVPATAVDADDLPTEKPSEMYRDLAEYWAPTIYQDVNETYLTRADIPTAFNYDGDWNGGNNWENLENYPQVPSAYFSVRETLTHYFIEYDFYYPRDDGPINLEKHENDLEGCILVIRKDDSEFGNLHLIETQAHNHWYQYSNDNSITAGSDNVDGTIIMDGHRPCIYLSANGIGSDAGHGVKAYDGRSANGGDGIIFKFITGNAVMPTDFSGSYINTYDYKLISMDELWNRRYDTGGSGHTYYDWGHFYGDTHTDSSCTLPWIKDDPDDGPVYAGVYWSDPAFFIDTHLNGLGTFSHTYTFNPYYTHKITVFDIMSCANKDTSRSVPILYEKRGWCSVGICNISSEISATSRRWWPTACPYRCWGMTYTGSCWWSRNSAANSGTCMCGRVIRLKVASSASISRMFVLLCEVKRDVQLSLVPRS